MLLHGREAAGSGTSFDLTALAGAVRGPQRRPQSRAAIWDRPRSRFPGPASRPDAKVKIVRSAGGPGEPREAMHVVRKDSNTLFATLEPDGTQRTGVYDVQVEDAGRRTTVPNAFTVNVGKQGKIVATISSPAVVRAGRPGIVTVEYFNDGETDVVAPLLGGGGRHRVPRPAGAATFSSNCGQPSGGGGGGGSGGRN